MRKRTKLCRLCGEVVVGGVDHISSCLLCVRCCMRGNRLSTPVQNCYFIVSEQEALEVCGVSVQDLNRLQYLVILTRTDSRLEVQRYYLRGEVRYLRNLRRKEKLEAAIGLKLKSIDARMRDLMLRDYLSKIANASMSFERVQKRWAVLDAVRTVLEQSPGEYPEAVFDFFTERPSACPEHYWQKKAKMIAVFEMEGDRILKHLPPDDRATLKTTPLAELHSAFEQRDSASLLRAYLAARCNPQTVDEILLDKAWRTQSWASGYEDRLAAKLAPFWKERAARIELLECALIEKRLPVPLYRGSPLYNDYVNGQSAYQLKEAVAVAALTYWLEGEHDICINSRSGVVGLNEMLHNLNEIKVGHYLSLRRGIEAAVDFPLSDEEGDDDDDDEEEEGDGYDLL